MSSATDEMIAKTCKDRIDALMNGGGRKILGIVGPPGCGKSTLAAALLQMLGNDVVAVPMDGYHLANTELARLGRAGRKGAEDTFDSAGYVSLLRRLKEQQANEIVYAPEFRRDIEEAVAGAIAVEPGLPLVITEGNYLLLDEGHWAAVRASLDEVWWVDGDEALRLERLHARHVRFGRTPAQATAWIASTDEPNARRIEATRSRADFVFRWD